MRVSVDGLWKSLYTVCIVPFTNVALAGPVSVRDGHQDVFAGVILELPQRRCRGERHLRLLVVEHVVQPANEQKLMAFTAGKDGARADIDIDVVQLIGDHSGGAVIPHVAECSQGLHAYEGMACRCMHRSG